jgi:lipopolysaccharide/colanic/teichoic acid biosynthesis glycosyltransferase
MPAPIQRLLGLLGLIVLAPLIIGVAVAVRLSSPGPVFHRARRHHPRGTFVVYKFRTMRNAAIGPAVTVAGDPRVTRVGRVLRRLKLDELPPLWNVARGDMLLVGPRPEDPRYVDLTNPIHAQVFAAPPGITSPAALAYRDEERVLGAAAARLAAEAGRTAALATDLERAYREIVQPKKLQLDLEYLRARSLGTDVRIIARTIGQVLPRTGRG